MSKSLLMLSLLGLFQSRSVAQTILVEEASETTQTVFPVTEQFLNDFKLRLMRTIEHLQSVNLKFTVSVDWLVPDLPRVTGETAEFYLHEGQMLYRFERTFPPLPGRPAVIESEQVAYDGHIYYAGKNTNGSTPGLQTLLGDNPDSPIAWQKSTKTCLYLEGAGFRLPRKVAQWRGGALTSIVLEYLADGELTDAVFETEDKSLIRLSITIPDPSVFDAHKVDFDLLAAEMQEWASPEEINKTVEMIREVRASKRQRLVTLWLDTRLDNALVRRIESTTSGELIYKIEARDFQQFGDAKIWLPRECSIKTYVKDPTWVVGFTEHPNRTDSIELTSVIFQDHLELPYTLNYGPGAVRADSSSAAAQASVTGEIQFIEPAPLNELREAAGEKLGWNWLLIVNTALILIAAALWLRHTYTKR